MIKIKVEAVLNPTEDLEKVKRAIKNVVDLDLRVVERYGRKYLVGESSDVRSLEPLFNRLRYDRILDTARSIMRGSTSGNLITLNLSRTAAYAKHVSFIEEGEEVLGPIRLMIIVDDPEKFLDWIAPRTVRGKPIKSVRYEDLTSPD
ncbi:MAG: RNA-binding domain-containing protein [Candidatus Asgardarchaeia archaeon]